MFADYLRISLEVRIDTAVRGCFVARAARPDSCLSLVLSVLIQQVINLTLSAGPETNEHLVYALLERHALFDPLRPLPE